MDLDCLFSCDDNSFPDNYLLARLTRLLTKEQVDRHRIHLFSTDHTIVSFQIHVLLKMDGYNDWQSKDCLHNNNC